MKLAFTDFWAPFSPERNFFTDALRFLYDNVQITTPNLADVILCSVFGQEHREYIGKIPIVKYIGEPRQASVETGVVTISFDYDRKSGRNVRLPLWLLQYAWFCDDESYLSPNYHIPVSALYHNRRPKYTEHLSVSIFNHDPAGNRIPFLRCMQEKGLPVHAFGRPFGNWFFGEQRKFQILRNFKFFHCFENSSYPGYHTEKLIHGYFANCIPVYWSSNTHELDFNSDAYLFLDDGISISQLIEKMIEIDKSRHLYERMIDTPLFKTPPTLNDVLLPIIQLFEEHARS
jgi:hypothetical protein